MPNFSTPPGEGEPCRALRCRGGSLIPACRCSVLPKRCSNIDLTLHCPHRCGTTGGNVDITARIVGELQEHGWRDSYLEKEIVRREWGGLLGCVCVCFFSSVKFFWCLAAQSDVVQSGGQQAVCTGRGHLKHRGRIWSYSSLLGALICQRSLGVMCVCVSAVKKVLGVLHCFVWIYKRYTCLLIQKTVGCVSSISAFIGCMDNKAAVGLKLKYPHEG